MESVQDTDWDVVISGTGFSEALVALALSRSGLKVLHVDKNEYYGSSAAALNLEDAQRWAKAVNARSAYYNPFSSASIADTPISTSGRQASQSVALGSHRRYSLTLLPTAVLSRSALLSAAVSARIDQQLEFVAHGNTWLLKPDDILPDAPLNVDNIDSTRPPSLTKVPNSREDILYNSQHDAKDKRTVVKFLRFVADLDGEDSRNIWWNSRDAPFDLFLADKFGIKEDLLNTIHALAASSDAASATSTQRGLRRIERHIKSMGWLGPGFGAVLPKWGGLAEVVQVACRAQAVGGGVYMLGHGLKGVQVLPQGSKQQIEIELNSGDKVKTRWLVTGADNIPNTLLGQIEKGESTSHCTCIVSGTLDRLFAKPADESPEPAAATVTVTVNRDTPPIQIVAHSSTTEECPAGQCILYAQTKQAAAFVKLGSSVLGLLASIDPEAQILWQLRYEHTSLKQTSSAALSEHVIVLPEPEADIVFDEGTFEPLKTAWKRILALGDGDSEFLKFPSREGEEAPEQEMG